MGKKEKLQTIEELNSSLPKSNEPKLPSLEELNSGLKKKVEPAPSPSAFQSIPETTASKLESANITSDLTPGASEQPKITVPVQDQSLQPAPSYQTAGDVNTTGGTNPDNSILGKMANAIVGNKYAQSFLSGTASLAAGIARSPAYLADVTNRAINTINPIPQVTGMLPSDASKMNNPLASSLEDAAANIDKEVDKDFTDKEGNVLGASDYFDPSSEHFDLSKGFSRMAVNVNKMMPIALSYAAAGAGGLSTAATAGAGTAIFGAQEKQQLLEHNKALDEAGTPQLKLTDDQINNVSMVSGAIDGVGDAMFGNIKFGAMYKNLFAKEGEDAAKKVVKDGIKKVLLKATKQYAGTVSEEAVSEGTQTLLDNLNHIYIGGDTKIKPMDGVMESIITAAGAAGVTGSGTVPISALNHVRLKEDAAKAQKIKDQQEAIRKEIKENPDINPITKSTLVTQLHGLNAEEDALIKKATEEHGNLPDDKKEHVDNLLKKNSEIATAALDPNITKETKDALVAQIDKNDEKVKEVYKENEKILKEKEAAVKKETDAKKESAQKITDQKEEFDYLSHLKDSIGLDEVEQKRYDELSPNINAVQDKKDLSLHQKENGKQNTNENIVQKGAKNEPRINTEEKGYYSEKNTNGGMGFSGNRINSIKGNNIEEEGNAKEKFTWESDDKEGQTHGLLGHNDRGGKEVRAQNDNGKEIKQETPEIGTRASQKQKRFGQQGGKSTGSNSIGTQKTSQLGKSENESMVSESQKLHNVPDNKNKTRLEGELQNVLSKNKQKESQDLIDTEELPTEKQDDETSVKKLNDDITVMKSFDKKDLAEKKYTGMLERAFKMREEGKISKPTFTKYKKMAQQVLGGKLNLDKEELNYKVEAIANKLKDKLLGEGYKKIVLSAGAPITPQNIADLIDLTANLVKRGISAGFTLKKAADNAIEAIKKHPSYKKLMATEAFDEKEFENQVKQHFPEEKKVSPKKSKKRSVKSLSTNLHESEKLLEESKKIIKDQGLDREVYANSDANKNARKIIDEVGQSQALELAKDKNSDIPGGVRAMIFGHIINDLNEAQSQAKTDKEKNDAADIQANTAIDMEDFFIQFEKQSTDAGRFASAIGEFYKMSPLGLKKKIQKDIDRTNTKKKSGMRSTKRKFTELKKELDAIDKEFAPPIEKPEPDKLNEIRSRRKDLFSKLKDSFNNPVKGPTKLSVSPLSDEQVVMLFNIAKTYFEEGVIRTKDLFAKLNKDLKAETGYKLSDKDMENVLNQKYENKTFREVIAEKEAPINKKEKREKQIKAIERALKGKQKNTTEAKKEYDRLIELHEKGVPKFFEDAFYEKFGLVDANKPEVQAKLDEFSAKIANAPEGILKNNEQVKYLNWLKDYRKNKYIETGMSAWYADILSSYETHLRNIQFNGVTSLITMPLLLAQKAIMKGNFSDVYKNYNEFFSSFAESLPEAKGIVKSGQTSRFEDVAPSNALERSGWTKWLTYPGRFLRAEDILFTLPLYNMKQREIFSRIIDERAKTDNVKLTPEARDKAISDLMGYTQERKDAANEQSAQEIEKIYGPEWKDNSEATLNQKIRINEIMDQSRPLEVREEARAWAKKALLTNKPEGLFGIFSDGIGFFLNHLPALRAVVPFINVPLNITNQIIERSPLGFIKVARGKVWFDKDINGKNYGRELTPEERKELALKATNYTTLLGLTLVGVAMGGGFGDDDDAADFIVTGKEGDFYKNQALQKGGGLEPYTIYIGGKNGIKINYQNTPLASVFSPVGFYRDYLKYEDTDGEKNLTDGITHSTLGFLNQVIDAASMKGMKEVFKYMDADERKKMSDEGGQKAIAKLLNTMFPYSGLVKATEKDVKGLVGADEKAAHSFYDHLVAGLPFDYYQDSKVDILGRPIKSQFSIPLVPYQKKNLSEQGEAPDEYYKVFKNKHYDTTTKFIKTKNAYTDKKGEFTLTKQELYDLNKERGQLALKMLNKKDKSGKVLWDKMKAMSDERFAGYMDKVLQSAKDMASIKTFVLDGKLPEGKTLKSIYNKYRKEIKRDKTKEKPIKVL